MRSMPTTIRDVRVAAPLKLAAHTRDQRPAMTIRDVRVAAPLKQVTDELLHAQGRLSATYASRPR